MFYNLGFRPAKAQQAPNVIRAPNARAFFKKTDFSHSIKVIKSIDRSRYM